MKKAVDQIRAEYTEEGGIVEGGNGRVFFDNRLAKFTDLSGVRLLHCGVDTVRQHYRGRLRGDVLALTDSNPGLVQFAGQDWHFGRIGRDSGYQYRLQNADLGLILLFKNFNVRAESHGPHLKIEVSPHAIDQRSPESLQALMDECASAILDSMERSQCAVHIALDVQGWEPPSDMVARLHCKATRQRRLDGVTSFEYADHSAVYSRGQSFLWGSAGACQLAIYNKTLQAKAIDKLDYWERVWRRCDSFDLNDAANYNPEQPVWRIELRYHHSVVQQFSEGSCNAVTGECLNTDSYSALAPHLEGLWRYGFRNFALLSRPGVFDAAWTLFREDARIDLGVDSLVDETEYRRHYKTARGFSGKNIDLMVGNLISLLARQGVGAKKGFEAVKQLPCWEVIREYYAGKDMTERDVYKQFKERLQERVVRYGRAV